LFLILFFEDGFGFWAECNGGGGGGDGDGGDDARRLQIRSAEQNRAKSIPLISSRLAFDNNLVRPLMLKSRGIRFARDASARK